MHIHYPGLSFFTSISAKTLTLRKGKCYLRFEIPPNPQPLDKLWTRHFSKEEKMGTAGILDVHVRDTRRF